MSGAPGDNAFVGRWLRDKWRLDHVLGRGGMATVFAGTHRNGARAAIKLLHPTFDDSPDAKRRFVREGRVANTIEHPGVVKILDDDVTEDGFAFLVMELLEGETWKAEWERAGRKLPMRATVDVAIDVLDILHAAHLAGVVHRDVKPENVFRVAAGGTKLLDFGIARLREAKADATQDGSTMGTPAFMSPEQALAHWDEVDARSDLFAVGACIWTQLTGKLVHVAGTVPELMVAAVTRPARPFASVLPEVPAELAQIVDRALAFRREDRWPDAASMRAALVAARPRLAGVQVKTTPLVAVPAIRSPPVAKSVGAPTDSAGGSPPDRPGDALHAGAGPTLPLRPASSPPVTGAAGPTGDAVATLVTSSETTPSRAADRGAGAGGTSRHRPFSGRAIALSAAVVGLGAAVVVALAVRHVTIPAGPGGSSSSAGTAPAPGSGSVTSSAAPTASSPACGASGGACCASGAACLDAHDACRDGTCRGNVKALFAGLDHTCAVLRDGRVACWGAGSPLLGSNAASRASMPPETLPGIESPTALAFGEVAAFAIVGHRLVGWGSNANGLLGAGAPRRGTIESADAVDLHLDGALDVAVGTHHADTTACAIVDQEVRCWGRAGGGVRSKGEGAAPTRVKLAEGLRPLLPIPAYPVRVGIGASDFACAQLESDLFDGFACWGTSKPWLTLDRETAAADTGISLQTLSPKVSAFAVGRRGACAASGRTLSCWGVSDLCATTHGGPPSPPLTLPGKPTDLAIGGSHACAVIDGKLWCWGRGAASVGRAEEGPGTCAPHEVALPQPALNVVTGAGHTCVLTTSGGVVCFGQNDHGQLGCTDARSTPTACRVPL